MKDYCSKRRKEVEKGEGGFFIIPGLWGSFLFKVVGVAEK